MKLSKAQIRAKLTQLRKSGARSKWLVIVESVAFLEANSYKPLLAHTVFLQQNAVNGQYRILVKVPQGVNYSGHIRNDGSLQWTPNFAVWAVRAGANNKLLGTGSVELYKKRVPHFYLIRLPSPNTTFTVDVMIQYSYHWLPQDFRFGFPSDFDSPIATVSNFFGAEWV